eukprot:jgi/Mesvir1/22697/Mv14113-RA.1
MADLPLMSTGGGRSRAGETAKGYLGELLLYAATTAISACILFFGLRRMDPNREASKRAAARKKEISARLGRGNLNLSQYEDIIACDVVDPSNIDVTLDSIGGLQKVKASLHELVILPLKRPELFSHGKLLRHQLGVLLYGPPGTGKTMLAKAIAKECNACFINVRLATLQSKWYGDAQKLVTALFTLAWKIQPSVIFLDEIDGFLGSRRGGMENDTTASMKTEFMSLWDGFATDHNARVMVLAATNRPWELDEAILRRLPRAFEVGMPGRDERKSILKTILRGEALEPGFNYDALADATEGYTGSDLNELCKQAAYHPIREFLAEERRQASLGQGSAGAAGRGQNDDDSDGDGYDGGRNAAAAAQPPRLRPLRYADFVDVAASSRPSKEAAYSYYRAQAGAFKDRRERTEENALENRMSDLLGAVLRSAALAKGGDGWGDSGGGAGGGGQWQQKLRHGQSIGAIRNGRAGHARSGRQHGVQEKGIGDQARRQRQGWGGRAGVRVHGIPARCRCKDKGARR